MNLNHAELFECDEIRVKNLALKDFFIFFHLAYKTTEPIFPDECFHSPGSRAGAGRTPTRWLRTVCRFWPTAAAGWHFHSADKQRCESARPFTPADRRRAGRIVTGSSLRSAALHALTFKVTGV